MWVVANFCAAEAVDPTWDHDGGEDEEWGGFAPAPKVAIDRIESTTVIAI